MISPLQSAVREDSEYSKNVQLVAISLVSMDSVAPFFMFLLSYIFLPGLSRLHDRIEVPLVLRRVFAMVIVGMNLLAAIVSISLASSDSIVLFAKCFLYSAYSYFIWRWLPGILGISYRDHRLVKLPKWCLVISGIPFVAGIVSRYMLIKLNGEEWYREKFIPRISPITLLHCCLRLL